MKKSNNGWYKRSGDFLLSTPYLLWVMLILIPALFTLSQTIDQTNVSYSYKIGDVAGRDIKAPKDFLIEDSETNQAKKNRVKETIRTVYDFDGKLPADITADIASAMDQGRSMFIPREPSAEENAPLPQAPTFSMALAMKPEFEKKLGIEVSNGAYQILFKQKFSREITQQITTIVNKILTNGVVANKEILLAEEAKGVSLRTIQSNQERIVTNLKVFYGPDQAKTMVRIFGQPILKDVNYSLSNLIVDISQRLIRPNITLNKNETEKRILNAQAGIKPILYQIKTGEMIIREGERVDKLKLMKLNSLSEQVKEKNIYKSMIGVAMLTGLLLVVIYYLFSRIIPGWSMI